jgi:hypothetical protein
VKETDDARDQGRSRVVPADFRFEIQAVMPLDLEVTDEVVVEWDAIFEGR